jgi:sugar phosphate isomerase/epimerase
MELSFHSQIASGKASLAEVLALMADAGMMKVESRSRAIDWFSADRDASRRRTAEALATTGVELHAVHSPFGPDADWCAADPAAAESGVEVMEYVIPTAAELGAGIVVIHPSRGAEGESADRMRARVEAGLEKLLASAERDGVRLALENMPWKEQNAQQLAPVIDDLASTRLVACLDTGHANMAEGAEEAARAFGRKLGHLHLHDNHGESDEHLIPPNGTIDWAAVCSALQELEFAGPLNFEVRPAANQGMSLRETREHLERFVADLWQP